MHPFAQTVKNFFYIFLFFFSKSPSSLENPCLSLLAQTHSKRTFPQREISL